MSARPYYAPAGFGGDLRRGTRPGVVVVDLQLGFTDADSPLGCDAGSVVRATRTLLDAARTATVPIWFTTIEYAAADHVLWQDKIESLSLLRAGSRLAELDPRLTRRPTEPILVKRGASAFFQTELADRLAATAVDTLVVCGASTSGCVRATVVDALQHELPALLVRDCVADRDPAAAQAALFDIAAKYGSVVDLNEAITYVARGLP